VVTKATPVITWANPAAITFGTPLGATQLDASTPVPGTFSYNPSAGTVLQPGNGQTLKVTFNPTDTTDYNPAGASVAIDVVVSGPCISGVYQGALVVGAGQAISICGGTVDGGVTVQPGGSLWVSGGTVNGNLSATTASALTICGSRLNGQSTISGSTGPVSIGGTNCSTGSKNSFGGGVSITKNTGGVVYVGNSVTGSVTITDNSGGMTYSGDTATGSVQVSDNT
jgi:hypothetical protein